MKRVVRSVIACLCVLFFGSTALAGLNRFSGKWRNVDPDTRGITVLNIVIHGKNVSVHAWGKCHPEDCDWGQVKAVAYAPSVSADLLRTSKVLSARFRTRSSDILLIMRLGKRRLFAEALTHFTDGSNRTDYVAVYKFKRAVAMSRPVRFRKDCVPFNPGTAKIARIRGHWKIIDRNHWLFDFGDKKAEAMQALRIIKFYRMNQSCFVGRPGPSFQYLLVSGRSPAGECAGEDCVSFNPDTATVKRIKGRWKIVDGRHWLFDFGNKKTEAEQALRIIKTYRFRYSCFVGRPHASFRYLRE